MHKYKVDHINLTVPNIEKAVQYFKTVLGFTVKERFLKKEMEFVFLTDGNLVYEIVQNLYVQRTIIDHIAYVSENIEEDFIHFDKLGLTTSNIGYIDFLFDHGIYYFFIQGVDGEKIEFCQRKVV